MSQPARKKAPPRSTDELSVLLSESKIEGYTIKGWTLKQLVALSPHLGALADSIKASGLSFDTLEGLLSSGNVAEVQGWDEWVKLSQVILPFMPTLISIGLEISLEEAEAMPAGTATLVGLAIIGQNVQHLVSFFERVLVKEKQAR